MTSQAQPDGVVIARIGKPHGIRGEVTVQAHTDDPERRFFPGAVFATQAPVGSGVPRELTLASARLHRAIWLLAFEGIPDRTGAEGLRGTQLLSTADDEGDDDDAWYEDDLLGFTVVTPTGDVLGEVTGLDIGAAQDRLIVRLTDGTDAQIPFVEEIVPEVDEEARRIVVDAPPGLLDLARDQ
ncbi:ribosome maturation factor RimM [Kribbia dieselivorans]|uniref:ribosome maturation factor RimM n=1 Tax=Kribbia dieselivorans TaxID=331526 RepID=UPI000837FEAF|nr:ribosome maturation factor RimM [Kribbia dieselivorans]